MKAIDSALEIIRKTPPWAQPIVGLLAIAIGITTAPIWSIVLIGKTAFDCLTEMKNPTIFDAPYPPDFDFIRIREQGVMTPEEAKKAMGPIVQQPKPGGLGRNSEL